MTKPRFEHDCERCQFLGAFEDYDLYFCPGSVLGGSVVARFNDDGPDYASSPISMFPYASFGSDAGEALKEGAKRAFESYYSFDWPLALSTLRKAHDESLTALQKVEGGPAFYDRHMKTYIQDLFALAEEVEGDVVGQLKIAYATAKLLAYAAEDIGYKLELHMDRYPLGQRREILLQKIVVEEGEL